MSAPDVFGLVVRSIGLLMCLFGLWQIVGIRSPDKSYQRADYVTALILFLIVGLALLAGADHIVRFSYGDIAAN